MGSNKVLLMGCPSVGKSTMLAMIFEGKNVIQTRSIRATKLVEKQMYNLAGKFPVVLHDFGGQDSSFEIALGERRKEIFENVQTLIYVFSVERNKVEQVKTDNAQFRKILVALKEFSPTAPVTVIFNKMDSVNGSLANESVRCISQARVDTAVNEVEGIEIKSLQFTSYIEDSLFKAWNSITRDLLPETRKALPIVEEICMELASDEAFVFDADTNLEVLRYMNDKVYRKHNVFLSTVDTLSDLWLQKAKHAKLALQGFDFANSAPLEKYFTRDKIIECMIPLTKNTLLCLSSRKIWLKYSDIRKIIAKFRPRMSEIFG